jgi:predicted site-specific integrase-resolvase
MKPEDMLSRRQFGNLFHVTRQTVRNWAREGIIRESKIGETHYIHRREEEKVRALQRDGRGFRREV